MINRWNVLSVTAYTRAVKPPRKITKLAGLLPRMISACVGSFVANSIKFLPLINFNQISAKENRSTRKCDRNTSAIHGHVKVQVNAQTVAV